jgi:hypothetical protein
LNSDYIREVHSALQTRKEKTILINRTKLLDSDIELINELAEIYNKTVKFVSLQEIVFNKDDDTYIVK